MLSRYHNFLRSAGEKGTDPCMGPAYDTVVGELVKESSWLTLSKALEKSITSTSVCPPAFSVLARSEVNSISCVSYDLLCLKPCWFR